MKFLPVLFLCALMANAAEVKISQLPETNAPSASAVIPIVDAGANWKVQKANLLGTLTNWAKLSTNAASGLWTNDLGTTFPHADVGNLIPIVTNNVGGMSVVLQDLTSSEPNYLSLASDFGGNNILLHSPVGDGDTNHFVEAYLYTYGDGSNGFVSLDFEGNLGAGTVTENSQIVMLDCTGQNGVGVRYVFGTPDPSISDELVWFKVGTNKVARILGDGSFTSNGSVTANTGLSSLATDAPVAISSTGWTNSFTGKAAKIYANGTNVTYTLSGNAGTLLTTNVLGAGTTIEITLQTSGKMVVTAGVVSGRAVPW